MIGQSLHGRGLFALRSILAGECVLRISTEIVITPDKLHHELKELLQENVSSCARLALLILSEQFSGQASEWAPYMKCLPQFGALHNTVLWNDYELELLRQSSSAYRRSMQFRTAIYEEFAAVQHVIQQCPHLFGQGVTRTHFVHAYAVVNSRAWGIDEGNTVGLVPFVDFFNHSTSCQSFLSFDKEYKYAEVLADRGYNCGAQVFINYGNYGNDVLAEKFGFTVEDNPNDQVEFWMGLSQLDALYNTRLELLQSHGMPMVPRFSGPDDCGNFFPIREVKTINGRGKGIPHSLRALARVLCANSDKELIDMAKQASQLDGRLARQPFKDVRKELEAMMLLLTRLDSLIQDHVGAISALEVASFFNVNQGSVLCTRRKMALDILNGEVRILCSATNWLKNHCTALKSLL
ncbi:hypothetical protein GOP47_0018773 [Adiantum capillus-veneris]|uniref:SET domain-containing protein n=1 Tax=Adiantum capillus-veneris TaxID=13818 RepID=A0A9D4UF40_ADICA|nr:hypothetical protein GOP47_0018773 [Adiantum capillus-veneris]